MTDSSFNKNSTYFLTNILPWALLALGIILFFIMIYHCRKGGECYWRKFCIGGKKNKNQTQTLLTSDIV